MKKGLILYQSKYGSAKKYANWLQEMTSFDCLEVKKAPSGSLNLYETIILCGAIYASGISGISYLKKNPAAKSRASQENRDLLCRRLAL